MWGGSIPRRYFWLFDAIVLVLSLIEASYLLPFIQKVISLSGLLGLQWVQSLSPPPWNGEPGMLVLDFFWFFLPVVPGAILCMETLGGHRHLLDQSYFRIAVNSFLAPLIGFSLIATVLFAARNISISRLYIFCCMILSAFGLSLYRIAMRAYFMRRRAGGRYAKNVLLIGMGSGIDFMTGYLRDDRYSVDYRIVGVLDVGAVSILNLGERLVNNPIEEVFVIYPDSGGAWLDRVIADCDYFRVVLRIVPEAFLASSCSNLRSPSECDPLRLPAIVLTPPDSGSNALFVKRLIDTVVSAALLIVLSPLFVLIAIAIRVTMPGLPIFYPWRVVGKYGVEFTGYKFTTMVADADEKKADLMPYNEMEGPVFKIGNDPRITPVGRFLRKYSLNELPQLWSVLKGDMSLVGPRPAFRHELEGYRYWQKRKLSVRPGITCLWQVSGRNKIKDFDDWAKMDLEYIDNWSLWLDFKILARTVWEVIAGTGS